MKKLIPILLYVTFMVLLTTNIFCEVSNNSSIEKPTQSKQLLEKPTQETSYLKEYTDPIPEEMPTLTDLSLKMLISLGIVLIILITLLFIIKKYFPNKISLHDSNLKLMKVIEKIAISPKQYIYLVWVVDRLLVLGINNGNLTTLSEIKDQATLEAKLPNEFSDTLARANLNFSEIYNG